MEEEKIISEIDISKAMNSFLIVKKCLIKSNS